MKVAILVGMPVSGKTTNAKFIGQKHGIPLVETGEIVYDEVRKRGLEVTPENIKKVSTELKAKSDAYFTERAVELIRQRFGDRKLVFLSGIRASAEVDVVRSAFGERNVFVIAFLASRAARYKRLVSPQEGLDFVGEDVRKSQPAVKAKEDKQLADIKTFVARDDKELSFGIANVISLADYYLTTESERWPHKAYRQTNDELEAIVKEIMGI